MKQQDIKRNKGKKDKEIKKEESENTTKTATILWRFLLAIYLFFFVAFCLFWAHQLRLEPFMCFLSLIYRDFKGSQGQKILDVFGGFSLAFPKKTKEGQG